MPDDNPQTAPASEPTGAATPGVAPSREGGDPDFGLGSNGDPANAVESAGGERDEGRFSAVLANTGLALAAVAGIELLLTIALGLAVDVQRLSRVARIGYAFLTQMEKSPLALVLVLAALAIAGAARLAGPGTRAEQRTGLAAGLVLGFAVILAIGCVLGVIARYDVGDLVETQRVDTVTTRVLAIFIVRNVGAAAIAFVLASTAVRARPRA